MRPFVLVSDAIPCPAQAVSVDSPVAGAQLDLSHWEHSQAPASVSGDTGCEMVLSALDQPELWHNIEVVVNDHLDADGLLSAALACRGEVISSRAQRALLTATAATTDFTEFHHPAALRLALTIHQHIHRFEGQGDNWQQHCYQAFVEEFEDIIARSSQADPQRDASVAVVMEGIGRLRRQDGISLTSHGPLWLIQWNETHGHQHSFFNTPHIARDDCPVLALSAVLPLDAYQLCSWRTGSGWHHILDAPRYSWAGTCRRIPRPWPDAAALAARLSEQDTTQWLARPDIIETSFTGLLGTHSQGSVASVLSPEEILDDIKSLVVNTLG